MHYSRVVLAVGLIALAVPATASAAAPPVQLAGQFGTLVLPSVGGCITGPTSSLCGDPVAPQLQPGLQDLLVAPSETLTLTVDPSTTTAPVANLQQAGPGSFMVTPTGPFTYSVALSADLPAVAYLGLSARFAGPSESGDGIYAVRLRTVTPPPADESGRGAALPVALPAKVGKKVVLTRTGRVRWTVTCPAAAGTACLGTATLKLRSNWAVLARETFSGLAPGASRTFSSRVKAPALRRLKAHPRSALRGQVQSPDGLTLTPIARTTAS